VELTWSKAKPVPRRKNNDGPQMNADGGARQARATQFVIHFVLC
jgi:hypothetical protein